MSRRHIRWSVCALPPSSTPSPCCVYRPRAENASVAAQTCSGSHLCHPRPLAIEDAPAPSSSSPRCRCSLRTSSVRRRSARRPRPAAHSRPGLLRRGHLPLLLGSLPATLLDRILQPAPRSRHSDLCRADPAAACDLILSKRQ